jgi:AcrR family transcriptional regulator
MTDDVPLVGLRQRKQAATRRRIAEAAARLAAQAGVAGVTADRIAEEAEVSRATFFRYFQTKETAIAEGFSSPAVDALLVGLASQPADLGPVEALVATFRAAGAGTDEATLALVAEQAALMADSPSLQAWVAAAYLRDEVLLAEVLAERMAGPGPDDTGPRLVAAAAMTAIRLGLERWMTGGQCEDLTELFVRILQDAAPAAGRVSGGR